MNSIWIPRHRKGFVQFKPNVLRKICRHRQLHSQDKESGGVLLGRLIKDSDDIVIDYVSTPRKGDIRTRTRYIRGQYSHQRIVDLMWHRSNQTCNYLGEWHTHPEAEPRPSKQDICNWQRILRNVQVDYDMLFFVIVGRKTIKVWEGDLREERLYELKSIPITDEQ